MLLDKLFAKRAVQPTEPGRRRISAIYGLPAAGVRVDEDIALNYSAVWSAVSMIANTLAIVSWQVFTRSEGRRDQLFDDPLAQLLNVQPNPETNPTTFKRTLALYYLLWGNAYAEIERNGAGRPMALWPLHPARVTPERQPSGKLVYEVRQDNGFVTIPADDMYAPIGMSHDGIVGISPIQAAKESISMGLSMEQFGARFFGHDCRPSIAIKAPNKLSETASENIKDWLKRNHGGPSKKWEPAVLEEGMEFEQIGVPPESAQFLESRKFQISEIARWFNIPEHKLAEMDRATFNNIDSRERMYVTEAVLPMGRVFEEEANRKLVPVSRRARMFTKFNFNTLMRGDVATRTEHYRQMFGIGAFSPNDIRVREDMNPIRGGWQHYVPGNMLPLSQGGSQVRPERALFDVFEDAAARNLRKQYKAVTRAAGKDGFESWLHEFYGKHFGEFVASFRPPVRALADQLGAEPPIEALQSVAKSHCETAVETLAAADSVEQAAEHWTADPASVAKHVMDQVTDAVAA